MNKLTKQIVTKMLKENTGIHMYDSGGAYSRAWQRNKKVNFEKEPVYTVHTDNNKFSYVTKSTYHHMTENLEYSPEMQAMFRAWRKIHGDTRYDANLGDMEEFIEFIDGRHHYLGSQVWNTCNDGDKCILDQTLQGIFFIFNDEDYVILQVHGGCDVRSGYTKPKIFKMNEEFVFWGDAVLGPDIQARGNEWTNAEGDLIEDKEELPLSAFYPEYLDLNQKTVA